MVRMEMSPRRGELLPGQAGNRKGEDECSSESGVDESEFKTMPEEYSKLFSRNGDDCSTFSFEDVMASLSPSKTSRKSTLSHVELDPIKKQLKLKVDRSNIRTRYGYDEGREAFLYPEEALYLLEIGKVEIFYDYVSLSVQRARSLLIKSQRSTENCTCCTPEEYLVYKSLARGSYCVFRYKPKPTGATGGAETRMVENSVSDVMEECDDIIEAPSGIDDAIDLEVDVSENCYQRTVMKRKLSLEVEEDDDPISTDSDNVMDSCSEDFEGIEEVDNEGRVKVEPGGYTVDEADSDIEIVDEVIYTHGGVEIQEIGHSTGCFSGDYDMPSEPVPSTSRGPPVTEVFVDLVSSDDEEDELRLFSNKVWNKFVPNSKLVFGIPPSALIPQTLPNSDAIYEFDLKDKSDVSDLELEFLVDEVSLNDDRVEGDAGQYLSSSASKSWKEWRQSVFMEARTVMNESLLASSDYINGESAGKKLFLWQEEKITESHPLVLQNIVYEIYGPAGPGFSRNRAAEGKPAYYVFVARQDTSIPDFGLIGPYIEGVPILIAIVCDCGDNDIVFMTPDRSPLNSLF